MSILSQTEKYEKLLLRYQIPGQKISLGDKLEKIYLNFFISIPEYFIIEKRVPFGISLV